MIWVRYLFIPLMATALIIIFLLPSVLSDSNGRIIVDREITHPLLDEFDAPVLLVFFGYVGCSDVCPSRLGEMVTIYRSLETPALVQPLFISLIGEGDVGLSQRFAQGFHPDFEGIAPDATTLQGIKKEFDVYIAPSLFDADRYDHTAFLYLLTRQEGQYRLRHIYAQAPFDVEPIAKDIHTLSRRQP